jgi:hypothetical protein
MAIHEDMPIGEYISPATISNRGARLHAIKFPSLVVLLLASPAAFAADKITFQGLDGASTRENVLKAFPEAKVKSTWCRAGETVLELSDGEYSCFELSVDNYVVGSRRYDLNFAFAPDGKLRFALLTWDFGGSLFEHFTKSELREQYEGLYKALNYKHGDPLDEQTLLETPTDCLFKNGDRGRSYGKCAEWQSGPSQKFEPGQNHIELELSAWAPSDNLPDKQIRPDEYGGFSGEISVTYTFADERAAEKL